MEFRIADTFTDSLAKLTGQEQKAVKTTAFDMQMNPANPGMQFHKLDRAKDANFWSVRVTGDIRLIIHRTKSSFLLCYVDHHDNAYKWAERRKLETHPKTGAAQFVEIREKIEEVIIPVYVESDEQSTKPLLFSTYSDDDLLKYGVPVEWLDDVRKSNEDSILEVVEHLPGEAAEALLNLAIGVSPPVTSVTSKETDPFNHPDAQRRFRVMTNVDELEQALEYPWEKWMVFLHPDQRKIVEHTYNGPAKVAGSAGTGKTIVALHRAVFLANSNPDATVLLTTFSEALANAMRTKLRYLISSQPRLGERIEVASMDAVASRLYERNFHHPHLATTEFVHNLIVSKAAEIENHSFTEHFLVAEWEQVIDAWQIDSWKDYRDVARLGRKVRLPEKRRKILWSIFKKVKSELKINGMLTHAEVYKLLAEHYSKINRYPYEFIVVDEAQDISISKLRFLAAIGSGQPDRLFFAGDLGQRIFQQPFSWKSLGIDIRGRSKTLKVNYRTSHQIRSHADRLLGPHLTDVDGNIEERKGTVSVFNGPIPEVYISPDADDECEIVGNWLKKCLDEGMQPQEIAVFVRSNAELFRAEMAVKSCGYSFNILDNKINIQAGSISIATMDLAKGMEFRAVVVMSCDDEIVPLASRIEAATDDSDLEDVYNTERHLLYVACTRARDKLFVTGVEPGSEFLDDIQLEN